MCTIKWYQNILSYYAANNGAKDDCEAFKKNCQSFLKNKACYLI